MESRGNRRRLAVACHSESAYTACFDLTMGVGVPLLGAVASVSGYGATFAASSFAALASLSIALLLSARPRTSLAEVKS